MTAGQADDHGLETILYRRLANDPTDAVSHARIGLLQARRNHFDLSVPHLAFAASAPDYEFAGQARLVLAGVYRRHGAPTLALTSLLPVLAHIEGAWRELSALFDGLNRSQQYDQVANLARIVMDAQLEHRNTWLIVGHALQAGVGGLPAVSHWQRAIKAFPQDLALRRKLAQCFYSLGRRNEALSEIRHILDAMPGDDEAWYALSRLELANRRWPQALDAASRAIALNPGMPVGHDLRLESMLGSHRFAQAESFARTWLMVSPNDSRAHSQFATCLHKLGRVLAAEPHWFRALELAETRARAAKGVWARQRILSDIRPVSRMGELAKSLDIFVKTGALGWREPFRGILAGEIGPRTNVPFLDYWRDRVDIVTDSVKMPKVLFDPDRMMFPTHCVRIGNGHVLQNDKAYYAVEFAWREHGHKPVLKLKDEHRDHGQRVLKARGMPLDAWFVVLHVREDGFHNSSYRNARSCQPASFISTIERIAAHGGWVCRIGDPSMSRLPPLPNLIDVTSLDPRDGVLDIFLVAAARFMVATSSGPLAMAICFGTPQLLTNVYPINERAWCGHDRFMPKIYQDVTSGKSIPFHRALVEWAAIGRTSDNLDLIRARNLAVIDNTPGEIMDAAEEMLSLTSGRNPEDAATIALQERYDSYCRAELSIFSSRIAGSFIRRHADLL